MSGAIILMYHIIDESRASLEDKYCCTPQRFSGQMAFLRQEGYRAVSLESLLAALDGHPPAEEKMVAVTFDDGFACTCRNALPVLVKHQIPATMFVVSDRIGKSNDWMQSRGFPRRELLTVENLRELGDAGVAVGSHTRTHPRLNEINSARLTDEIRGSKASLEDMLGKSVDYFAYPFGLYNEIVRNEVEQAGYLAACSTRSGFNRDNLDRFLLRRIEVYGSDSRSKFRQKLKFGANDLPPLFPLRYYVGRLAARMGLTGSSPRDS
jgi:peptidoglycan/xylan/chitin deacetylase (PgdA/CDA1 family)